MLAIRLARTGAKKKPSYRVVVIDKRNARDGKNLEIVGHYNPTRDPIELSLESERIDHWIGVGAQASVTVKRLMAYKEKGGPTWEPGTRVVTPLPAMKPKEAPAEEAPKAEVAEAEAPAAEAEAAPAEAEASADAPEAAAAPEPAAETPAPEAEKAPEAAEAEESKPPADA